ncbi:MAG: DUF4127 family protein [Candidatus Eremiobacterota bacterium]
MKRLVLAALALLLLAGGPSPARISLLPLDDRPANLLFVRQIARIAGAEVTAPPRHLLGEWLRPGQPEALAAWLQARRGDLAVVSTDMLCYGGLVASRTAATPEAEALSRLTALARLEHAQVEVLAVLPRLSLRTSDAQAPYERKLAYWAVKPDSPPPEGVPPEVVREYLAVRARNLTVLLALLDYVQWGSVQHLVVGQDDSAPTGLHRQEQERFLDEVRRRGLEDRVTLISGADELSMNLVSGYLARRAGHRPTVRVVYSDPSAAEKVPPMESLPLSLMIAQHLELAGARQVEGSAEVELLVQVPDPKPFELPKGDRLPVSEAFAALVRQRMETGRVAVADLSLVNRMDPYLAQAVIDGVPLWKMEGFAAWNTPANALGTAVSQLVVHRLAARSKGWTLRQALESEKTHQAFLLARLIDDYGYQTLVRTELAPRAASLPPSPDRLLNLYGPLGLEARLELIAWSQKLFRDRFRNRVVPLVSVGREAVLKRMDLEVVLPWQRTFEVEARLNLSLWPVEKP